MARALMYHDVVDGDYNASGFRSSGAARYKFLTDEFEGQLKAIAATKAKSSALSTEADEGMTVERDSFMLTFDDGGVSGCAIADSLERYGWRGHFLITTDCIGTYGFLTKAQIRELDSRGHVIGSHTCSHPARMSSCTRTQLLAEWTQSRDILCDILGKAVTVGSVPGGYYSRTVAETAAEAGLKHLFTSEPTPRNWNVGGCRVYGRYTVYRGMTASGTAALAAGVPIPLLKQTAAWKLKKVLKTVGGRPYLQLREVLLGLRYQQ